MRNIRPLAYEKTSQNKRLEYPYFYLQKLLQEPASVRVHHFHVVMSLYPNLPYIAHLIIDTAKIHNCSKRKRI